MLHLSRTTRIDLPAFLSRAFKLSGPVEVSPRFPFLLFWINRFLICLPGNVIRFSGPIFDFRFGGFGLVLLSHLYRGLFHFVDSHFASFGGPFWFLQLWILAYFPDFLLSYSFDPRDLLLGFSFSISGPRTGMGTQK